MGYAENVYVNIEQSVSGVKWITISEKDLTYFRSQDHI